jgi:hypothetical protein
MADVTYRQRQRKAMTPAGLRKKKAREGSLRGDEQAFVRVSTTATKILVGDDDLSEWTDEELRRGRRMVRKAGRNQGRFVGRDPIVVPKKLHDELVRRTMSKANALLNENLLAAVQCLIEICTDKQAEDKDRVMGKAPDKVEIRMDAPWLLALQGGIVSVNNDADVIDVGEDE